MELSGNLEMWLKISPHEMNLLETLTYSDTTIYNINGRNKSPAQMPYIDKNGFIYVKQIMCTYSELERQGRRG